MTTVTLPLLVSFGSWDFFFFLSGVRYSCTMFRHKIIYAENWALKALSLSLSFSLSHSHTHTHARAHTHTHTTPPNTLNDPPPLYQLATEVGTKPEGQVA